MSVEYFTSHYDARTRIEDPENIQENSRSHISCCETVISMISRIPRKFEGFREMSASQSYCNVNKHRN